MWIKFFAIGLMRGISGFALHKTLNDIAVIICIAFKAKKTGL